MQATRERTMEQAQEPFDRAEFHALTAGDRELQAEVLRTVLDTAPGALEAARLAVEGLFPAATARAAHLLRGSLLAIAAGPAVASAAALEEAGHRGDLLAARQAFQELAGRMQVLLEALRRELQG